MSSTIDGYTVSFAQLRRILGSSDQATVECILTNQRDFLSDTDSIDEDHGFKIADSIADLIHGRTDLNCPGYLYGYGLKAICAHIGKALPNSEFSGIANAYDWTQKVDGILNSNAIPIKLSDLVFSGSPMPIVESDDYPFIGKWSTQEIPAAVVAMRSLDLSKFDSCTAGAFSQIRQWLEEAAKDPNLSIIGFLY